MASTNKTPNYNLPQWLGTDKPTYLGDFNPAFETIDTGMHVAKTTADSANTTASNAATAVAQMSSRISAIEEYNARGVQVFEVTDFTTSGGLNSATANSKLSIKTYKIGNSYLCSIYGSVESIVQSGASLATLAINFNLPSILSNVSTTINLAGIALLPDAGSSNTFTLDSCYMDISNGAVQLRPANINKSLQATRSMYFRIGCMVILDA